MVICKRCHREVEADAKTCPDGHPAPFWKVPGEKVFDWRLETRLGSGPTSSVYKAVSGEQVAAARFLPAGQAIDAAFLGRFRSDPKVQQLFLQDPDFVRLLDVYEDPPA